MLYIHTDKKHHNSNVDQMTGAARGSLSVRKTVRRVEIPQLS